MWVAPKALTKLPSDGGVVDFENCNLILTKEKGWGEVLVGK